MKCFDRLRTTSIACQQREAGKMPVQAPTKLVLSIDTRGRRKRLVSKYTNLMALADEIIE